MEQQTYTRHPAKKVSIAMLLAAQLHVGDTSEPSHIVLPSQEKVFRCSVICIILTKNEQANSASLLVDDGSGTMLVRSFLGKSLPNVGDIVLIIGKVRSFQNEKYLSPEIIKKVDPLWLKVRAKELQGEVPLTPPVKDLIEEKEIESEEIAPASEEEIIAQMVPQEEDLPFARICKLIQELDTGEGVPFEVVVEKAPFENTQDLLNTMLQNGDVFENLPGRVKLL